MMWYRRSVVYGPRGPAARWSGVGEAAFRDTLRYVTGCHRFVTPPRNVTKSRNETNPKVENPRITARVWVPIVGRKRAPTVLRMRIKGTHLAPRWCWAGGKSFRTG